MESKRQVGVNGEYIAEEFLLNNGYKIINTNFSCYFGEIDIIAKDKQEYVFVEVKTRTNYAYGMPCEAVNSRKKKHIIKTIQYYTFLNKLENEYIRIDVIEIIIKNNKTEINHIKNAF